jgi:hypothetical protein
MCSLVWLTYMILALGLFAICLLLGLSMFAFQEIGRRIGIRRLAKDPKNALEGTGVIDGGLFAVWGLLLAFTFSGSASRFEMRRRLVGEEANDIGTAYLRLDLLSTKDRDPLKKIFHDYLDTRLETYQKVKNEQAWEEVNAHATELQNTIWKTAVVAANEKSSNVDATKLLLPSLNAMIDITTTRFVATKMHPPSIVYVLLVVMSLVCALLIGFGQATAGSRSWLHIGGFIIVTCLVIYVTMDMEYPRAGLIRVDSIDQVLVDLKQTMK